MTVKSLLNLIEKLRARGLEDESGVTLLIYRDEGIARLRWSGELEAVAATTGLDDSYCTLPLPSLDLSARLIEE